MRSDFSSSRNQSALFDILGVGLSNQIIFIYESIFACPRRSKYLLTAEQRSANCETCKRFQGSEPRDSFI